MTQRAPVQLPMFREPLTVLRHPRTQGAARAEAKRLKAANGNGAPSYDRPKTRADCIDGPRPCPWAGCRHHLAIDVSRSTGSIKYNPHFPDELPETCSLDVSEEGEHTLEQVGDLMGLTRERVRQIEERLLSRLARTVAMRKMAEEE